MKKIILIALLGVFLNTHSGFAQRPDAERTERIEALKISFITDQLKLTPEEAKAFWPIFNQFEAEQKSLRDNFKGKPGNAKKDVSQLTEEEAEEMINNEVTFLQKELEILKKYITAFKSVLPTQKVAILLTLENRFKRMIFDQIKKGDGPPPPH
ncbi:MAG: hypothetical protein KDD32_12045 [Bacteroidetes bacterium]|nr:hypothetical protein [Bacteroidota bacterium]